MVLRLSKIITEDEMSNLDIDAIIIPGGGTQKEAGDPGSLPIWVKDRLHLASNLWNKNRDRFLILLSGGTMYKPGVLDTRGFNMKESTSMALYLENLSVNPDKMVEEPFSWDTIGNAFFCRTVHTDIRCWDKLLVIVPDFHLKRVKRIFDWIYGMNSASAYTIYYYGLPSQKTPAIEARIKKEEVSYQQLDDNIKNWNFTHLHQLHQWMHTEHRAYASKFRRDNTSTPIPQIDSDLLDTY